jgi:cellulose biosynthesis protein BcsQ
MSSIALYSPKGGVGKSTCAVSLAYLSAMTSKRRTLLWDIDAQGAAGYLLSASSAGGNAHRIFSRDADAADLASPTAYPQLSVLASDASLRRLDVQLVEEDARKRMRKLIRGLEADYERIIVDCPPGVTEISEQIFRAVDLVVIPVTPSALGMRAFDDAVNLIRSQHRKRPPVLPVFSMVDLRRKLHRTTLAAHPDWNVIPYASVVERMSTERAPVSQFAPRHAAARAFTQLWAEVENCLISGEAASDQS